MTSRWRLEEVPVAPRSSLTDCSRSLSGRQAAETRGDGASGRVRRREGRERRLRSGRLLHASPDHPQAAVVGKTSSAVCGLSSMDGPTCSPSLCLSLIHILYVSLPPSLLYSTLEWTQVFSCCCAVLSASGPASDYHMFIWRLFVFGWAKALCWNTSLSWCCAAGSHHTGFNVHWRKD